MNFPTVIITLLFLINIGFVYAFTSVSQDFISSMLSATGIAISLAFVYAIHRTITEKGWKNIRNGGAPLLLFAGWLISLIASSLFSDHPGYSRGELTLYGCLALLAVAQTLCPQSDTSRAFFRKSFPAAVAIFATLFSIHAIAQYLGADFFGFKSRYGTSDIRNMHVYSIFGNPNLLADHLALLFPIIVWGLAGNISRKRLLSTCAYLVTAGLTITVIYLTGSRAGLLAAAAGAIITALLSSFSDSRKKRAPRIVATTVVLVTAVAIGIIYSSSGIESKKGSVMQRVHYAKIAIQMFKQSPVIGNGAGHYRIAYIPEQRVFFSHMKSVPRKLAYLTSVERPRHPHNEFLNSLVETGIIGTLMFAAMLLAALFRASAAAARGSRENVMFASVICAFAVDALFGFPLSVPPTAVVLFLSVFAAGRDFDTTQEPPSDRSVTSGLRYVALVAPTLVAAFVIIKLATPLMVSTYIHQATMLLANDRLADAVNFAEKAQKLHPTRSEPYFIKGTASLKSGYYSDALEYYGIARRFSCDVNIDINRAIAIAELGDFAKGIKLLESVSAAVPGDPKPYKMSAVIYSRSGNYKMARKMVEKALHYRPSDPDLASMMKELDSISAQKKK